MLREIDLPALESWRRSCASCCNVWVWIWMRFYKESVTLCRSVC